MISKKNTSYTLSARGQPGSHSCCLPRVRPCGLQATENSENSTGWRLSQALVKLRGLVLCSSSAWASDLCRNARWNA